MDKFAKDITTNGDYVGGNESNANVGTILSGGNRDANLLPNTRYVLSGSSSFSWFLFRISLGQPGKTIGIMHSLVSREIVQNVHSSPFSDSFLTAPFTYLRDDPNRSENISQLHKTTVGNLLRYRVYSIMAIPQRFQSVELVVSHNYTENNLPLRNLL